MTKAELIYYEPKGKIFLDANDSFKGLRDGNNGGLIAKIQGAPELNNGGNIALIVMEW